MKPNFAEIVARAAQHEPDTSAVEYGFETRLAARLRSEAAAVSDPVAVFLGQFSKALWRSAAGLSPVLTAVAVWFFASMDTSIASASTDLVSVVHELKSLVDLPSGLF